MLVVDAGSVIYPSHITNLLRDWPALPSYHQVGDVVWPAGRVDVSPLPRKNTSRRTRSPALITS